MSILRNTLSCLPPSSLIRVVTPLRVYSTPSTPQSSALERVKYPNRGGRNLSDRYRTLERSIRGKQARSQDISTLEHTTAETTARTPSPAAKYDVNTFHGFKIPEEPKPPADDECCMSGCAVCVYDLYEESLQAYKQSVSALRNSLAQMGIPEGDWPASIRTSSAPAASGTTSPTPQQRQEVVMSAFEQMELALRKKHAAQTQGPLVPEDRKEGTGKSNDNINFVDPLMSVREREVRKDSPAQAAWRKRRSQIRIDWKEVVEGIRWLLFSNR